LDGEKSPLEVAVQRRGVIAQEHWPSIHDEAGDGDQRRNLKNCREETD
jgi:hypothetical protein